MKLWPTTEKKGSCRNCKADLGNFTAGMLSDFCELGFPIYWIGSAAPNRHIAIPKNACPKPLTYKELFEARKNYTFKKYYSKLSAKE
jgi:hypothetical protein